MGISFHENMSLFVLQALHMTSWDSCSVWRPLSAAQQKAIAEAI